MFLVFRQQCDAYHFTFSSNKQHLVLANKLERQASNSLMSFVYHTLFAVSAVHSTLPSIKHTQSMNQNKQA